ncbi:glycerol-3-phosphate 1-O-acyltransferase PlsY [Halosquirtibacter xylanolyticus]|uniref:glycerol-3-phosphate 1-O-acyltransferase PlsY n=1 Tax=Halosquirtibacter xylanolyticus TaxID=3374599 RepID=UPI0037481738|nr:glycerol-3-phosphate 1-O-acyltransferase PlsY [Prolixibacteraceae bacterium]
MENTWIVYVVAYIMGSIPCGYWFTMYVYRIDIRQKGSGNIGSTNVGRFTSKRFALFIQVCDMLKGLLPVGLAMYFYGYESVVVYRVALLTVLGHCFSIFTKFKGGKGVNTAIGSLFLIEPISVIIGIIVYYMTKHFTHYVSMSSITMSVSWVLSSLIYHIDEKQVLLSSILCLVVVLRHRNNIIRLMKGEEPKTVEPY